MIATTVATQASTVAREVLRRLESAWNSADGAAFGAVYAPDASFVTIRGDYLTGRNAIAVGHHGIFTTIYAGSLNRMELLRADEIADGVVVSIAISTLDCPSGPLVGVHQAMSTSVIARQDGPDAPSEGATWLVLATHNTLVAA